MDNIKEKIQAIFKVKFNVEIKDDKFEDEISLGSNGIGMDAIQMFYFINYVEKEFDVVFTREQVISGQIRTLSGVCQSVKELQ